MLTEKEIELIEDHLRGKLNDEDNSLVERKIASDSLYKEKYDELFSLSKAIERFEQHKNIIDRIKKQTTSNTRREATTDSLNKVKQSSINKAIASQVHEPTDKYNSIGADRPIINLARYLTSKNLGIAASFALIFGFSYYFITNNRKTIQEYSAPSKYLIEDSLKTDSLETANDSLKALKNFLK